MKSTPQGWFRHLSHAAKAEYNAIGKPKFFLAGSLLFEEDQLPSHVYVLDQGRVKITKCSRQGKTFLVKIATVGDVIGLSSALSNLPYGASAEAIDEVRAMAFPRNEFLRFVRRHIEASMSIAEGLNGEFRSLFRDACCLALYNKISCRVAHMLLGLAIESRTASEPQPRFQLLLTHDEISAMLGSSRESVTRALNSFRRRRIISIKGKEVTILQRPALELLL